jgi:hypothetical protein
MITAHYKPCVLERGRGSEMLEDWHHESDKWDPNTEPQLIKMILYIKSQKFTLLFSFQN